MEICDLNSCSQDLINILEMLEYLLVQVSSISCNVVGSILALHAWKTLTAIVGDWWTGVGDTTELLTSAKKSQLGYLISFQLPMGFQNLIEIFIKNHH